MNANEPKVAGRLQPRCTCCANPLTLAGHDALGSTRRFCPASGSVYLDRGDGRFFPDGTAHSPEPAQAAEPDIASDRPVRSEEKTRISLERATFA